MRAGAQAANSTNLAGPRRRLRSRCGPGGLEFVGKDGNHASASFTASSAPARVARPNTATETNVEACPRSELEEYVTRNAPLPGRECGVPRRLSWRGDAATVQPRGAPVEIAEVVDRWLAPDHRYFKVKDSQGDLYILRNDVPAERWELTLLRRIANGGTSPPTRPHS
jgi:hypothetical protein